MAVWSDFLVKFWICPRMEIWHRFWAPVLVFDHSHGKKKSVNNKINKKYLRPVRIYSVCCLSSLFWTPLWGVWLCLLQSFPIVVMDSRRIPIGVQLSALNQSSPWTAWWPSLHLPQCAHISLVLRSPALDTALQYGHTCSEQRRRITFLHLLVTLHTLLCHKGALLVNYHFIILQEPEVFYCRAAPLSTAVLRHKSQISSLTEKIANYWMAHVKAELETPLHFI